MAVRKEVRIHISRAKYKKTSQGSRNVKFSSMNKNKRKLFKAYRGQGR